MKRDQTVDNLRGLAMFGMIVIHASSYYLRDRTTLLLWDNLQWVVPVFFFSSFYLFFLKTKEIKKDDLWPFFKKRFSRLFLPYFVFLAIYFFLVFFFQRNLFNLKFFLANVFLYGGLSFNWITLIFLYFSILLPLVWYAKRNKIIYWGIFAVSVVSSFYFIFAKPIPYRVIFWLPWLTYMFFVNFFIKNIGNKKKLFTLAAFSFILFLALRQLEISIGPNLTHDENKYPPTIYHLSFGVFWVVILHWLSEKNIFAFLKFDRLLYFLSINSYPIFFLHLLAIFIIQWLKLMPPNWPIFFVEIFGLSVITQILYLRLGRAFSRGH